MSKWMTKIAVRLGLTFMAFVVLFTVLAATGNRALTHEVAQWRAAGLIEDEADRAERPASEALQRWNAAVDALTHHRLAVREALEAGESVTPEQAADHLRTLEPLLAAIHAAALADGPLTTASPAEAEPWIDQLQQRLLEVGDFPRLLEAEARWHTAVGDRDAAARAIEAGVAMSSLIGEHGVWIAQLLRLMLLERMLIAFEQVYAEQGLPPAALRERLAAIDLREELIEGIRSEAVLSLRLVSGSDPLSSRVNWTTRGWWYHDAAYLMEQYRACIALLRDRQTPMAELPLGEGVSHPFWARSARVVLPALDASLGARLAVQMRLAMARTAIHLREHALASGDYPESLDAVDVPHVEPGLVHPIHYQAGDAGFVLRSTPELEGEPIQWTWR